MMTKKMDALLNELGIKNVADKTDDEFEADQTKYTEAVETLDLMENDLLSRYGELDVETYLQLRQIDLLKKINDKLDDLEMLYDVYNQLKTLNGK